MNIRKETEKYGEADIDALIEIAAARNYGDINRTMLEDTLEEKRDYILMLDDTTLEQLIAEAD